jgi:hypothetical protein
VNPKGLALFLGGVLRARAMLGMARTRELSSSLLAAIEHSAARTERRAAWGYPFPWQSRFFFAPAGTPNAVVTATLGWHLLEWADRMDSDPARELGHGAALYLSESLPHQPVGEDSSALSYVKQTAARIVNVSMLGARLLMRTGIAAAGGRTKVVTRAQGERMVRQAQRLARFGISQQQADGSWRYAVEARGNWSDSYHTGFILESLLSLRALGVSVSASVLDRGFGAYSRFFGENGGARYSNDKDAPYDAHSAAQGIVTYAALGMDEAGEDRVRDEALGRMERILAWTLDYLWLPEKGHFAYRIDRGIRDERDYMRWVQAWMALALGTALEVRAKTEALTAQAAR